MGLTLEVDRNKTVILWVEWNGQKLISAQYRTISLFVVTCFIHASTERNTRFVIWWGEVNLISWRGLKFCQADTAKLEDEWFISHYTIWLYNNIYSTILAAVNLCPTTVGHPKPVWFWMVGEIGAPGGKLCCIVWTPPQKMLYFCCSDVIAAIFEFAGSVNSMKSPSNILDTPKFVFSLPKKKSLLVCLDWKVFEFGYVATLRMNKPIFLA